MCWLYSGFIGPLIIYLAFDDDFAKENTANALNWQIVFTVGMFISGFLTLLLIGLLTAVILILINIIFCVIAAVKANDGETWNYPLTPEIV